MGNKATGSHIKDHPALLSDDEIQPEKESGTGADLDEVLEIVESKKKKENKCRVNQPLPWPPTALQAN